LVLDKRRANKLSLTFKWRMMYDPEQCTPYPILARQQCAPEYLAHGLDLSNVAHQCAAHSHSIHGSKHLSDCIPQLDLLPRAPGGMRVDVVDLVPLNARVLQR
jgi:hypothetical protein